jgi:uncharacterized protein (TIGR00369 family)
MSETERPVPDATMIRDLMPTTPFIKLLGLTFDDWEPDRIVLRMPFAHQLTNDGKVFHGGAIASLIDTAGAAAAWSGHDMSRGMKAATVGMSLEYLGATRERDLVATARALKRGKELIFTDIDVADSDGKPVAKAILTYRIVP